jgi:hypothetical protein
MKKVLVFVGIAALMCSAAAAEVNPAGLKVLNPNSAPTEGNGTLGSTTIDAWQTGPLEVELLASATTQGGDGQQVVVTFNGNTYTLNPQVWVYGQIYDSPWNGGCTFWTTSPGTDWCAYGEEYFVNAPTALHSFEVSFTTTVPTPMNYQTFVISRAGLTWITTGFYWFNTSQSSVHSVVETIYVDSTQPPTPTPPPGGFGGEPIPTLNWIGILAMIAILGGIAVLVMNRR